MEPRAGGDGKTSPRLLYVLNHSRFFLSHRVSLAERARENGFDVHVATMPGPQVEKVRERGFPWHALPLDVQSVHPVREARLFATLVALYRRLAPELIHHVTMKPVTYGSMASRLAGVPAVVNAVSGFGYLFLARGIKPAILRVGALAMMRVGFAHPGLRVIVQNRDDARDLLESGVVDPDDLVLIPGSGVDLDRFSPAPEPTGTPVVLLATRMLRDKGVAEFVEAAELLSRRGVQARFVMVGDPDPNNPRSLKRTDLECMASREGVEWWGHRDDMPAVMQRASLVCLPSYREGLPKVLIEAAAMGRPIVTTDVPGCRDVVQHGANGLLVPPRNAEALADAVEELIDNPNLRDRMGHRGRHRAETEFALEAVVERHLELYSDLTNWVNTGNY